MIRMNLTSAYHKLLTSNHQAYFVAIGVDPVADLTNVCTAVRILNVRDKEITVGIVVGSTRRKWMAFPLPLDAAPFILFGPERFSSNARDSLILWGSALLTCLVSGSSGALETHHASNFGVNGNDDFRWLNGAQRNSSECCWDTLENLT